MSATHTPYAKPAKNGYAKHTQHDAAGLEEYVFGKVQPQAVPLEEAVLGAIMLDREALPVVMDVLKPESFYLEAHQHIYRACLSLYNASNPVDVLTVTDALMKSGQLDAVGGGYYLVELSNRVASSANIEYHARIIAQANIKRQAGAAATRILQGVYDDGVDAFDLLESAERALFDISMGQGSKDAQILSSFTAPLLKSMETAMERAKHGGVVGVGAGIRSIDRLTGGWQNSDLIIIAGRPGMGKTSAAIGAFAYNAAKSGTPVAVFSLEMSALQLMARVVSADAGVPSEKIRNGSLSDHDWQQIQSALMGIDGVPLFIDDTAGISIMEMRAKARRLKKKHNIGMIVVDYLQLMSGGGEQGRNGNRDQEIGIISRGLKGIAKDLDIPVIALSQLSRNVETRGGSKRPGLSDLRESGNIEQEADVVGFIYRPEYYGITDDGEGNSLEGVAEFIIAKHRNGALDTAIMKFTDKFAKFSDQDEPTMFPATAPPPSVISAINNRSEDTPF